MKQKFKGMAKEKLGELFEIERYCVVIEVEKKFSLGEATNC
jgi:hypothetical protein